VSESVRIPLQRRKKTSIWVDEFIWSWFVPWTHLNSTSSCEVIDAFLYSLYSTAKKIEAPRGLPAVTVNLAVNREVQRPRRSPSATSETVFSDWGTHLNCHFCKRASTWIVYYSEGWDHTIRVYCCGHHVRQYRRMTSQEKGYPKISFQELYKR